MPNLTLPPLAKATAATILRWQTATGRVVAPGDVLAILETADGPIELQSPLAGTIVRLGAAAGQSVTPGTVLADLSPDVSPQTPTHAPAITPATNQSKTPSEPTMASSAGPQGVVIPIVMPQAGQSMEEGTIVKWLVKPGDTIAKGQIIFEVETDKATMEVEAVDAGRLAKIVLDEGGTTAVKEPVAYLADSDADVAAYLGANTGSPASGSGTASAAVSSAASASSVTTGSAASAGSSLPAASTGGESGAGRLRVSPAARKIAAERQVDLASVSAGSGPGGRILSIDVPPAGSPAARPFVAAAISTAPTANGITAGTAVVRKRMSAMRKAIAKNLLISKQTIPHFYLKVTIDAGPLYAFYQGEKAKYPISLNDVIVAASARVLIEFPAFRTRIEADEMVTFPSANIGIAVGLDDGLVVPVVAAAEARTLAQLGLETKRLAANARSGRIEGMGTGVFTITNLGMFGTEEFAGIINPPEAAILAVGAIREEVIVSGGTLRAGRLMSMTLSADHRVVDGMAAAKFMARLKELLEYPQQLI